MSESLRVARSFAEKMPELTSARCAGFDSVANWGASRASTVIFVLAIFNTLRLWWCHSPFRHGEDIALYNTKWKRVTVTSLRLKRVKF